MLKYVSMQWEKVEDRQQVNKTINRKRLSLKKKHPELYCLPPLQLIRLFKKEKNKSPIVIFILIKSILSIKKMKKNKKNHYNHHKNKSFFYLSRESLETKKYNLVRKIKALNLLLIKRSLHQLYPLVQKNIP